MTLLLLFNQPPYSDTLLSTASRLLADGEPAIAVVVAHMGFEVAAEQVTAELLRRKVDASIEEALLANLSDRTFSARSTRDLWTALTGGDRISDAPGWKHFRSSVEVRNQAVHAGASVSAEQAARSIQSVRQLIEHLQAVARKGRQQ